MKETVVVAIPLVYTPGAAVLIVLELVLTVLRMLLGGPGGACMVLVVLKPDWGILEVFLVVLDVNPNGAGGLSCGRNNNIIIPTTNK